MALSRIHRGFQACRSGLGALASIDGPLRGNRPSHVPARTLFGRDKDRPKASHSRVLTGTEGQLRNIFEIQVHQVKPECMEDYLQQAGEQLVQVAEDSEIPVKLLGSWITIIGTQLDQANFVLQLWRKMQDKIWNGVPGFKIWQYTGFDKVEETAAKLKNNKQWNEFERSRNKMITSRSHQIVLPFAFWDPANTDAQREPKGVYEMRNYRLRPGTLIEWGQAWEKGIQYRREESIGGWFSQIGEMHQVFHLWAYKNLEDRSDTRQRAWEFPGWDQCVVRTVPLIRYMEARIMIPAPYSPLK